MDLISLQEFLKEDKDHIIDLLNDSGFENINYNRIKNEIRCSREKGRNPTSIKINPETLGYVCFSTNTRGNIISLLQSYKGLNFKYTLDYISDYFDLDLIPHKSIKLPFGGFYKKILSCSSINNFELYEYPEETLKRFSNNPNKRFFDDNITFEIQEQFNIGFDVETLRITIPWRSPEGKLIGVIGRLNEDDINDDIPKYLAIIPFPKSHSIYGFSENYQHIANQTVWISEAEKSCLIAKSLNINNVISVGSHSISPIQVQLIKSLMPQKIIIAWDEGIEEEQIISECEKFKNSFIKYDVGYFNPSCLPKESKMSLFDLKNNKKISQLAKENIIWLEN